MKAKKKKNTLRAGLLFLIALIFLISVSVIFKVVDVVVSSRVDGGNFYSIIVSSSNKSQIIALSPKESEVAIVDFEGKVAEDSVAQIIGAPIFSHIRSKESVDDPKIFFARAILNYRGIDTDMTIIDLMRLYLSSSGKTQKKSIDSSLEYGKIDEELKAVFNDPVIQEEEKTIEIVNAAGEQGIAGRLGRTISNFGGEVILLTNSEKIEKSSSISYYGEKSYTVERLGEYLKFKKMNMTKKNIADVIITVGEDSKDLGKF